MGLLAVPLWDETRAARLMARCEIASILLVVDVLWLLLSFCKAS